MRDLISHRGSFEADRRSSQAVFKQIIIGSRWANAWQMPEQMPNQAVDSADQPVKVAVLDVC